MRQLNHTVVTTKVWLWRGRWNRPRAHCDCGWSGRPRWFCAAAIMDAQDHFARTGHRPASPIDKWKATRHHEVLTDLHAAFWLVCFIAIMAVALGYSVVPR